MSVCCSAHRWVSWRQLSRAVSAAVLRAILLHQQEIIRAERSHDDSLLHLEKYFPDDICVVNSVRLRFSLEAYRPDWWERLTAFLHGFFYPSTDRHSWYRLTASGGNTVVMTISIQRDSEFPQIEVEKSSSVPALNSLRIRI